ncbi:uncharacterized protein LOC119658622 [Hermetia illucens]|uniref:uncharacterized protein LOC119658622 n=1 Tax=Hermetia illucens TaxID=343691 RepID=UPI0018CC3287|nr:uncharacterized protein LOC119658622 [Hermetia illucens]
MGDNINTSIEFHLEQINILKTTRMEVENLPRNALGFVWHPNDEEYRDLVTADDVLQHLDLLNVEINKNEERVLELNMAKLELNLTDMCRLEDDGVPEDSDATVVYQAARITPPCLRRLFMGSEHDDDDSNLTLLPRDSKCEDETSSLKSEGSSTSTTDEDVPAFPSFADQLNLKITYEDIVATRPPRMPFRILRDYYKENTSDLCSDGESCPVSSRSKSDNGGENAPRSAAVQSPSDYISCVDDRSSGYFSGGECSYITARRETTREPSEREPTRQQGTFYRDNWWNRRFIPPARRETIREPSEREPARQQGTFYQDNWRNRRFIPPARRETASESREPARQQGTFYRDNWRNRRFIPPRILRLRKLGWRV